jgi:glutathionyl-hydroquinone reductase
MSTTSTAQANIRQWASKDGEFRRQVSSFRDSVSRDPNAQFAAEPYVLPPKSLRHEMFDY